MAQEQPTLQEKKAAGFFSSLRGLKKKDPIDEKDANEDEGGFKSPARSPRFRKESDTTKSKSSLVPDQDKTASKTKSGLLKKGGGSAAPIPSSSSGSLSKGTSKVFVPDSKQSAEVNAIRKRAWEEEQRLNAAIAAQFVYDPALSEDENMKNQLRWEGEQKLLAAMSKLHHDKEMVARAYPKEDQAVSSYAARFMKRSAKRKAKNPNLSSEVTGAVATTAAAGSTSSASSDSATLKPGRKQTDEAKQYLAQYAAMTPQAALKKRLLMSEAEREINEKSKADSYLNQFLEDKVDAPVKKGHVRRSSDSFGVPPKSDDPVRNSVLREAVSPTKRDSMRLDRKRSTSSANLLRTSLDSQAKIERKATQDRVLEMEQQKIVQVKNAPLARVSASAGGGASAESSDVEESSSTFESDGEAEDKTKPKGVTPRKTTGGSPMGKSPRKKIPRSAKKKSSANLKRASSAASPRKEEPVAVASPDSDVSGLTKSRRITDEELPKLLKLGNELGKGAFSLVYQAVRVEDNLAVAVKVIDLSRLTSKQLAEVDAERFILQQFHHPHVVNMLNVFETASRLYYVLELLPGGDLFNKILQRGCFSERATKRIIKQIAEAVAAMHAMGIVHRDLKPENILCIEDSFTKQIDVKVADFGIAKKIGRARAHSTCGSPGYVAPEVIRGDEYDLSVDMFSLGAILYVLLAGYPPFWGDEMDLIIAKNLNVDFSFNPMYWSHISEPPKDLIQKLLTKDPETRLKADEVLKHPFLK